MKLIVATKNSGKLSEIKTLLRDLEIEVLSATDTGFSENTIEDQDTFAGNALKKAREAWNALHEWIMADDSGLCIGELQGRPGVRSARWAGESADANDLIAKTLGELDRAKAITRSAHFETAVAIIKPDGEEKIFSGKINGKIANEPRGTLRPTLPYDSLFIPEGCKETFADMPIEKKNGLSHRAKALALAKAYIQEQLKKTDNR